MRQFVIAVLALLFLLVAPSVKADGGNVILINFTDTISFDPSFNPSPATESVLGSFDWNVDASTLTSISISASGNVFTSQVLTVDPADLTLTLDNSTGFYLIAFDIVGNTLQGGFVSDHVGENSIYISQFTQTATRVPEPSTWLLLLAGISLVGLFKLKSSTFIPFWN